MPSGKRAVLIICNEAETHGTISPENPCFELRAESFDRMGTGEGRHFKVEAITEMGWNNLATAWSARASLTKMVLAWVTGAEN